MIAPLTGVINYAFHLFINIAMYHQFYHSQLITIHHVPVRSHWDSFTLLIVAYSVVSDDITMRLAWKFKAKCAGIGGRRMCFIFSSAENITS